MAVPVYKTYLRRLAEALGLPADTPLQKLVIEAEGNCIPVVYVKRPLYAPKEVDAVCDELESFRRTYDGPLVRFPLDEPKIVNVNDVTVDDKGTVTQCHEVPQVSRKPTLPSNVVRDNNHWGMEAVPATGSKVTLSSVGRQQAVDEFLSGLRQSLLNESFDPEITKTESPWEFTQFTIAFKPNIRHQVATATKQVMESTGYVPDEPAVQERKP